MVKSFKDLGKRKSSLAATLPKHHVDSTLKRRGNGGVCREIVLELLEVLEDLRKTQSSM